MENAQRKRVVTLKELTQNEAENQRGVETQTGEPVKARPQVGTPVPTTWWNCCYFVNNSFVTLFSFTVPSAFVAVNRAKYTPLDN
jgi:hypothetical protein